MKTTLIELGIVLAVVFFPTLAAMLLWFAGVERAAPAIPVIMMLAFVVADALDWRGRLVKRRKTSWFRVREHRRLCGVHPAICPSCGAPQPKVEDPEGKLPFRCCKCRYHYP